jgi:ABC-type transport system substrate-binding protein
MWTMSSEREWTQDIRVREAFYRAFDDREHIDLVVDGWGVETPGKLTWAMSAYRVDEGAVAEYIRHDPQEAQQLLDAAGFDFDQTYELTTILSPVNDSALQVFSEQLRRVGLNNQTFTVTPAGEWLPAKSGTGDYDFVSPVGFPGWDGPGQNLRMNHTDPAQIHRGWNIKDPEIDELIERTEVVVDREEHIQLVKDLPVELTRRYAHMSHVYTPVNREFVYSYVRDWETYPWSVVMHNAEAWLDR